MFNICINFISPSISYLLLLVFNVDIYYLVTSDDVGSPDTVVEEGHTHSPYPEVDHFITKQLTKGGAQGVIRRWTLFPQGKLIVYDIKDYRWCENIGRPHKSNNIM